MPLMAALMISECAQTAIISCFVCLTRAYLPGS